MSDTRVGKYIRGCLKTHIRIQIEANKTSHSIEELEKAAGVTVEQMLDESIATHLPKENWDKLFKVIGYYMDKHVTYVVTPGRSVYSLTPVNGLRSEAFYSWLSGMYIVVSEDRYNIMQSQNGWIVLASHDEDVEDKIMTLNGGDRESCDMLDRLMDEDGYYLCAALTPDVAMTQVMEQIYKHYDEKLNKIED